MTTVHALKTGTIQITFEVAPTPQGRAWPKKRASISVTYSANGSCARWPDPPLNSFYPARGARLT
jgi:hypothetical protein